MQPWFGKTLRAPFPCNIMLSFIEQEPPWTLRFNIQWALSWENRVMVLCWWSIQWRNGMLLHVLTVQIESSQQKLEQLISSDLLQCDAAHNNSSMWNIWREHFVDPLGWDCTRTICLIQGNEFLWGTGQSWDFLSTKLLNSYKLFSFYRFGTFIKISNFSQPFSNSRRLPTWPKSHVLDIFELLNLFRKSLHFGLPHICLCDTLAWSSNRTTWYSSDADCLNCLVPQGVITHRQWYICVSRKQLKPWGDVPLYSPTMELFKLG